jgi:hypothetical protein
MDNKAIAKELGRAGGLKTKEKHGTEHFRKISNEWWKTHKKRPKPEKDLTTPSG